MPVDYWTLQKNISAPKGPPTERELRAFFHRWPLLDPRSGDSKGRSDPNQARIDQKDPGKEPNEPKTTMPRRYPQDPYWTVARFNSNCRECKTQLKKGDDIFYRPRERKAYCKKCGTDQDNEFQGHVFDEEVYNYQPHLH